MNAAESRNHIARAVEEAMGEPVDDGPGGRRGPWLPLSVRHGAAEAAIKFVEAWRTAHTGRSVPE